MTYSHTFVSLSSTFAWFQASNAAATKVAGSTGSIGVENATLDNDSLFIVPTLNLAKSDETSATSVDHVVYTDSEGEVYVAVASGQTYVAAAATRPATVGTYLKVTTSFVAYLTRNGSGTPQDPWTYDNPLTGADAGTKAARSGEQHTYTLDMSGRGKIGTSASNMYAADFNSTGAEVGTGSSPAATKTIAANTISKTGTQTMTIAPDGSIANSTTFYVGIDGSQYSCDVEPGNELYNEGEYGTGAGQTLGATTTVAINWIS